jgi:hypothetical protein
VIRVCRVPPAQQDQPDHPALTVPWQDRRDQRDPLARKEPPVPFPAQPDPKAQRDLRALIQQWPVLPARRVTLARLEPPDHRVR